jgi:hypothetical protein
MKNKSLIVLGIVATMVIGLGSLDSVRASDIIVSHPGNTVVKDSGGDLLLRNCNADYPNLICSLHPLAPLSLPGYFDIKKAKITQIGRGRVDLSIQLYEPIPAVPLSYLFIDYFWQFEGGCVDPQPGNMDGIRVHWDGSEWTANWYVITDCDPRTSALAEPVPFEFIEDGVKVRVALADLLTAIDPGEPLVWYVGVRRIPFQDYQPPGYPEFLYTTGVDYAPDVLEFLDCGLPPVPPCYSEPEDPATWEPR